MNKGYYALRFRCGDALHARGDIQYVSQRVLHVGQTPECEMKLPQHSDYDDICYAVIVRNENGSSWRIIRQNRDAAIMLNGVSLALVQNLNDGDRLCFDRTELEFTVENGDAPAAQYVKYKAPVWIWSAFSVVFLFLAGILFNIYENSKTTLAVFGDEVESICMVEADTLLVLSVNNDTLDVIPANRAFVGTGFITDEGYFVTARHCVEFWLGMESELRQNLYDIESNVVRKAIDAEMDSTIRLVSKLRITSHGGKHVWHYTSDDFIMDKSRDNLYDCGNFETPYIWRSIVSLFEKRDSELGDVAVMKWPYGKGNIRLEEYGVMYGAETGLCSFGYPQSENQGKAVFSVDEGKIYQQKDTPDECLICTKGFDPGFSGGPVFVKNSKRVIGIVSRSSDNHTLLVPVSQVHNLIDKLNDNGKGK